MSEQNEGWWQPVISRRVHYFRNSRSLCSRYGAFGRDHFDPDPAPFLACTSCLKKLEASKSA